MITHFPPRRTLVTLILILALTFIGAAQTPARAAGAGRVRVVHASAQAPRVDVYIDGSLFFDSMAYGTYSNYVNADEGEYQVDIRLDDDPETAKPLFSATVTIAADSVNTVVAQGVPGQNFGVGMYQTTETPPTGKALIQLVNTIDENTPVDLTAGGSPVTKGVEFGTLRSLPADEGVYALAVNAKGETLYDFGTIGIVKEMIYTYILVADKNGASLVRIVDGVLFAGAINASPNTPPIDIYLNGELQFENVEFKNFSDLYSIAGKRYSVALREHGAAADSKPIYETFIAVPGGVAANFVIMGKLDGRTEEDRLRINAYWGDPIVPAGRSGLNVIHALPKGNKIVVLESGNTVIDPLAYEDIGSASGPAQKYNIQVVDADNTSNVLIDLPGYELKDGKLHWVIALPGENGGVDVLRFFANPFTTLRGD
ncbi:MAG: DUF4397 domain-containing protein [Anaerolineales bacterium]|nr:DUF4397 domain-containing protein [Anaerolineales bacterium]